MSRAIEINDIVAINFNAAQYTLTHRAKVLHTPQDTGDSWYFEDLVALRQGQIHAVSEGCTITLLEPAGTDKVEP